MCTKKFTSKKLATENRTNSRQLSCEESTGKSVGNMFPQINPQENVSIPLKNSFVNEHLTFNLWLQNGIEKREMLNLEF
jgi:hypothetical protein